VLEDRLTETVADWFKAHPEVQVVARDRAEAYASGIRQGAPDAVQVADRFHLLSNLAAALHEVCNAHSQDRVALHEATRPELVHRDDDAVAVPIEPPVAGATTQQQIAHKRARRLATYEHVWALPRQGWSQRAIAAHMGCARLTVQRFLRAPMFPARQPRRSHRPTLLAPFTASLWERWNAGCHNGAQLYREIKAQGFRGQSPSVGDYVRRMRAAQRRLSPGHASQPATTIVEATTPLTPRAATWLVIRREETLDAPEKRQLTALQSQEGEVAEAIRLSQDFAALVRQRQPAPLDSWLERAARSTVQALARLATSLRDDYAAVKAGVSLPWSTGPVEGHINRLKMLKRQMVRHVTHQGIAPTRSQNWKEHSGVICTT
jgi:transposase